MMYIWSREWVASGLQTDHIILEDSLEAECMVRANITGQIQATGFKENTRLTLEMEEEHTTLVMMILKSDNGEGEYFSKSNLQLIARANHISRKSTKLFLDWSWLSKYPKSKMNLMRSYLKFKAFFMAWFYL